MLRHVETAVPGSTGRLFWVVRFSDYPTIVGDSASMARVAILAVLLMQALADQACQEETCQEESSTLMQLSHRDLDQTYFHILFFIYFQTKQALGDPRR